MGSRVHLATIEVTGRPATFGTAHEAAWKTAVRDAVTASGVRPHAARFSVRFEFRLAPAKHSGEVWDIDNLVKPTMDAMEGILGTREWTGTPQPADDRVDHIEALKRETRCGEVPGATIDVWTIGE